MFWCVDLILMDLTILYDFYLAFLGFPSPRFNLKILNTTQCMVSIIQWMRRLLSFEFLACDTCDLRLDLLSCACFQACCLLALVLCRFSLEHQNQIRNKEKGGKKRRRRKRKLNRDWCFFFYIQGSNAYAYDALYILIPGRARIIPMLCTFIKRWNMSQWCFGIFMILIQLSFVLMSSKTP